MFQSESKESFSAATRKLFSNPCFVVILWTGIARMAIYDAFLPFGKLFDRDIGVSYVQIGLLELIYSLVIIWGILIGSYLSDMFPHQRSRFTGAFNCLWGCMCIVYSLATGFWWLLTVYIIAGLAWFFQPASRTYLLEQSGDNKHLAMGLFACYRLPLLPMFLLLLCLFKFYGFVAGMRIALFFAGVVIVFLGIVRWVFLTDLPKNSDISQNPSLTGLIKENSHILLFICRIAPVFVLITCIDAVSDTLYNFLIYFFLNEKAGITEAELLTGRLTIDALAVPLILWLSFQIGKNNGKRALFFLYVIPTLTIVLLLVSLIHPTASFMPSFAPVAFKKLAFLGYSFKYISDFLWMLLLAPIAMSFVPRENATKAIGVSWFLVHISRVITAPIAGWLYQQQHITAILFSILALNGVILFAILAFDYEFNEKTMSLILHD
ncbi:MAG: MFS transporter [Candidatus Heimdallarchaeota archaeon]